MTTDSSVGRAGDCRMNPISDISRSLVQIRLGGVLFQLDANDFIERKKNILMIVARKFNVYGSFFASCILAILLMYCRNSPAEIAQLGEHQTEDLKVPGSIPGLGTIVTRSFIDCHSG